MNSSKTKFSKHLLLCAVGFVLGRALFFPGFVDPMVPSHNDLYVYFVLAHLNLDFALWQAPRPIAIGCLQLLGRVVDSPELFWMILASLSVLFVGALVSFIERIFAADFKPIAVLFYAALVFALPTSWEIYQLDFGGMLSGLLCIAAIRMFLFARCRWWFYGLAALLFWAGLEAKPTFGMLVPFVAAAYALRQKSRNSLLGLAIAIAISAFVLIKDKVMGSPFVGSEAGSIYEVRFDVVANASVAVHYLLAAVPLALLPGLALVYMCALTSASTRGLAVWMPVAALAAIAPMALIPNRVMDLYSWYSSIFLFAPLLFLGSAMCSSTFFVRRLTGAFAVVLLFMGLWKLPAFFPAHWEAAKDISSYNANIMESLDTLRLKVPDIGNGRLLVSGLRGPHHAFWNEGFVKHISGVRNYTRLLKRSESVWNNMAMSAGNGKYVEEIDLGEFDYFAIFDRSGALQHFLSKKTMEQVPDWWRGAVLLGVGATSYEKLTTMDFARALKAIDQEGEIYAANRTRRYLESEGLLEPVEAIVSSNILSASVGKWGPMFTQEGKPFNIQADGRSAMWVGMKGVAQHAGNYIDFGGVKITEITYHPTHVTFAVPNTAFSTAGEKEIAFVDGASGASIIIGTFQVKPAEGRQSRDDTATQ